MFGNKKLRQELEELREDIACLRQSKAALKIEILKLKHPAEYKVGDKYPEAGIIHEITLKSEYWKNVGTCGWQFKYTWVYHIINNSQKIIKEGNVFYDEF